MKLNPADQCLSLLLNTLTTDILPEVKSEAGIRSVQIMAATLTDLLKRHSDPSIELLRNCINGGRLLEAEIEHTLNATSLDVDPASISSDASFEDLAIIYTQVTERLHYLCAKLSASRANVLEATALLRRVAEWESEFPKRQAQLPARPFGQDTIVAAAEPTPSVPLRQSIQEFMIGIHGPLEITGFKEVVGGFGKETYFADITYPSGVTKEVVVRKSQAVPVINHRGFLLEREFQILRSLSKTGYPSPIPIDLAYESPGGTFFTMNRMRGQVLASSFLHISGDQYPENILKQMAELLAKLHKIPLETFRDFFELHNELEALHETVEDCYRRALKGWREYVNRVEHLPSPYIIWLFDWLENNIPNDKRPAVLTHGDFSAANCLAENGNITAVLDWESADFGAPEQDIAYIQPNITNPKDWEKFLSFYKAAGGDEIVPPNMTFCLAFGVLRFFVAGTRATLNLQKGVNRDIRYIMMELGIATRFMEMGLKYAENNGYQAIMQPLLDADDLSAVLEPVIVAPIAEALVSSPPTASKAEEKLPLFEHVEAPAPLATTTTAI